MERLNPPFIMAQSDLIRFDCVVLNKFSLNSIREVIEE